MIITCAAVALAQILPGDGVRVVVFSIDEEVSVVDGLCDLSGAAVIGETEMRFEHYGDSLVRRVAGRQADWLRVDGDTIRSLGADTRRENARYNRGLPYLFPALDAETGDTVRYSVFMIIDRENDVYCRYSSSAGCGFILPGGDTIASTYRVETEITDSAATVKSSRWYADGAVWPVVEQTTVKAGDQEQTSVIICPPENQLQSRAATGKADGRSIYNILAQLQRSDNDPTEPNNHAPQYAFTINADGITITGGAVGEDIESATARLYDTAGRQWHAAPATEPIPTSSLPAGVYLLQISTPTTTQTLKLTLN